ncbi:hypothetical protein OsI_38366 [Oryza sativa Indica Group]|uniref:DNA/RNA-binding protein Alba-like domain-containing protein n=1 Tax=Oryza sativa subsp. indica TaxID=39946 RepID=B8BPQ3_ORYSI|nr:hypothetical protein OsI_38366 [Oryza sativa Indica Group]
MNKELDSICLTSITRKCSKYVQKFDIIEPHFQQRYMQNYDEVELSALGMAIGTVVTVAEILKNNGLATEKKILTSTIGTKDESKGRLVRKAKIEILLCKSENFNTIMSSKKSDRPKSAEEEIKV